MKLVGLLETGTTAKTEHSTVVEAHSRRYWTLMVSEPDAWVKKMQQEEVPLRAAKLRQTRAEGRQTFPGAHSVRHEDHSTDVAAEAAE